MTTFVDTSALYAVMDADDDEHARAVVAWRDLLTKGAPLRTTNYVLIESFALVQHRLGLRALQTFVMDVVPVLEASWIGEEDHAAAIEAVFAAGQRRLSLVDCTSFVTMRRLGIEQAFAFDRDFGQQGFRTIPGQPLDEDDGENSRGE